LKPTKTLALQTFELDADRKVVAICSFTVARHARMPSALIAANELNQLAATTDEKMRRDFDATQLFEIRVAVMVEAVGEKLLNRVAMELTRGQADGVQDHQICSCVWRARFEVGRGNVLRKSVPTI
jgi:hypothetical protein